MSNDNKDLVISNIEECIDDLDNQLNIFSSNVNAVRFNYINKIRGIGGDYYINELTNSLRRRASSLKQHMTILINAQKRHAEWAIDPDTDVMMILEVIRNRQVSIFDSIIFHACSLFDYLGRLAYFVAREGDMSHKSWNSLVGYCKNESDEMSSMLFASSVIKYDCRWVDDLSEYRAKLFHYKSELGGIVSRGGIEHQFVTVYAPGAFVNSIDTLKSRSEKHNITLQYSAFWVLLNTIITSQVILIDLRQTIENRRKISKKEQPFMFKDPESSEGEVE